MCSAGSAWTLLQAGCPIRTSTDQRLLPASRRLSQVAASFFGSWCLGIHLGPLVACPTYNHSSITEERVCLFVQRIHLDCCALKRSSLTAFGFKRRSQTDALCSAPAPMRSAAHQHRKHALVSRAFSTYSVVNVLVEMRGFEPLTPCLQSRCSPS
jgi:hypothetical protein